MWPVDWMWDANEDRVDDRLQQPAPAGRVAVVVDFDHRPTDADLLALEALGFAVDYRAKYVDSVTGTVDAARVPGVAALDGVARVEKQLTYHAMNDVGARTIKARPSSTYADTVWDDLGYTGAGVAIAVLDTGVDDHQHETFAGKPVCGYDAIADVERNPDDDNGHGTHVAGTALGHGGASSYPFGAHAGVAPEADLVDVKVLDANGASSGSSLLRGIEWVIANKDRCSIDVMTLSLGTLFADDGTSSDAQAVNRASDAGLIATIAVGNHFLSDPGIVSPASADTAISVAAMNDKGTVARGDDTKASFSNEGPRPSDGDADTQDEKKPEVIAPGQDVRSASYDTENGYEQLSGTSMATPMMAGVVALMKQADASLTWRDVEDVLIATSEDYGSAGWDGAYGYGYVDAYAGTLSAEERAGTGPSNSAPTPCFSHATDNLTIHADGACSTDSDGTISAYAWDWGDGATGSGVTASHGYAAGGTYTVTLTVTDDKGASRSTSADVTVALPPNDPPAACFTHAEENATTHVDAACSTDSDGTISAYAWDFGDGTTASNATASHTYVAGGTYNVTLTVTDDRGDTATTRTAVTVTDPPNEVPLPCFDVSGDGRIVRVDAACSTDPDGTLASYAWDFGDGATAAGAIVEHAYAENGTFNITLTVTDDEGATGTATRTVTTPVDPDPDAMTLESGVPHEDGIKGQGSEKFYKILVPEGAESLDVVLNGPNCPFIILFCNVDLDLDVRHGARPTASARDCRSHGPGSDEACRVSDPAPGWWFVRVSVNSGGAYAAYEVTATNGV